MEIFICNSCLIAKPKSDFTSDKNYKDGIRKTCRICTAEKMRVYWAENPDKYAEQKARNNQTRPAYKRHHITKEQFDSMYQMFNGLCWSCKLRPADKIDHDHSCCSSPTSCGKCVRGLLCHQCNTALGLLQDSMQQVFGLADYIASGIPTGLYPVD